MYTAATLKMLTNVYSSCKECSKNTSYLFIKIYLTFFGKIFALIDLNFTIPCSSNTVTSSANQVTDVVFEALHGEVSIFGLRNTILYNIYVLCCVDFVI